jgi:hypothetical protein
VGGGIGKDDLPASGVLIRIGWYERDAFAVNPALAVTGELRIEVSCDHGSVFESASPVNAVNARERFPGDRKNLDAADMGLRAAIRPTGWLLGILSHKSAGQQEGYG